MKMKQQDFKINFKLAKLYLSKLISNISIPCSDGGITINQNSPKEIFLEENQYNDFQYVILWYCLFYVTFSVYTGSKSIFISLFIWVQLSTFWFSMGTTSSSSHLLHKCLPKTQARSWGVPTGPEVPLKGLCSRGSKSRRHEDW